MIRYDIVQPHPYETLNDIVSVIRQTENDFSKRIPLFQRIKFEASTALNLGDAQKRTTASDLIQRCDKAIRADGNSDFQTSYEIIKLYGDLYRDGFNTAVNENLGKLSQSQTETVNDSMDSQANSEQADKKEGRNQKRMRILKNWYSVLFHKHNGNIDLINEEINHLTNQEILNELVKISPNDKGILTIKEAKRWLGKKGKTVWGFSKTQGSKTKKPI